MYVHYTGFKSLPMLLLYVDVEDYSAAEKWQIIFLCILIVAPFLSVQYICRSGRVLG